METVFQATELLKSFGRRLRFLRGEAGFTQSELAELGGVSTNYIGLLERGERSPSLPFLSVLSKELGVSLSSLMDFESRETPGRGSRGPSVDYQKRLMRLLEVRDEADAKLIYEIAKKLVRPKKKYRK